MHKLLKKIRIRHIFRMGTVESGALLILMKKFRGEKMWKLKKKIGSSGIESKKNKKNVKRKINKKVYGCSRRHTLSHLTK